MNVCVFKNHNVIIILKGTIRSKLKTHNEAGHF